MKKLIILFIVISCTSLGWGAMMWEPYPTENMTSVYDIEILKMYKEHLAPYPCSDDGWVNTVYRFKLVECLRITLTHPTRNKIVIWKEL